VCRFRHQRQVVRNQHQRHILFLLQLQQQLFAVKAFSGNPTPVFPS